MPIYDGNQDEIIYSGTFNIYNNELKIDGITEIPGVTFNFIFQNTPPVEGQPDLNVVGDGNIATVTLSQKFRNTLGTGTVNKLVVFRGADNREILLSLFGQQFGTDILHVTINFYRR